MYRENQVCLKKRMKAAGVTIKEVSQKMKRPYSTIGGMLGGFTPLTSDMLKTIEQMIIEAEQKVKNDN